MIMGHYTFLFFIISLLSDIACRGLQFRDTVIQHWKPFTRPCIKRLKYLKRLILLFSRRNGQVRKVNRLMSNNIYELSPLCMKNRIRIYLCGLNKSYSLNFKGDYLVRQTTQEDFRVQ